MIYNCWLPTIKDSLFIIYVNQQLYIIFIPSRHPSDTFKIPFRHLTDTSNQPPDTLKTFPRHPQHTLQRTCSDFFLLKIRLFFVYPRASAAVNMFSISSISEFHTRGEVSIFQIFLKFNNFRGGRGGGVKPTWEFSPNFPIFF